MDTERRSATPPPSREHLLRYLRGELPPDEQHAVERRMEEDPLLREAVEGLALPGATAAAAGLKAPFAQAPAQWPSRLLGGALVIGVVGLTIWMFNLPASDPKDAEAMVTDQQEKETPPAAPNTDSVLRVVHQEIAATASIPVVERPTLPAPERFQRIDSSAAPVVRDTTMRPLPLPHVLGSPAVAAKDTVPLHVPRPSRQLVFLHDLKLVHPKEIYGTHPPQLIPAGVSADKENASSPAGPEQQNVSYLDLMDRAMGAFAEGRTSAALDDLYFLLGQYPDDVNAQFYAGLCCYELGLYPRAQKLLDRAAHNTVDTFNEESAWYLALAMEQQRNKAGAEEAFARIAEDGGFYAAQAKAKLGR